MSRKRALIIVGIIVILLVCAFTIAPKDGGGITGLSADDGTYYSVAKDGTFSKDYVSDYKLVEDEIQQIGKSTRLNSSHTQKSRMPSSA